MATKKDSRLARAGVSGYNKPKRTPGHPKKSHIVVAKEGDKIKTIRFGQKGAKTAGKPKAGESAKMKAKRKSFKARHGKNIKKGKMSAAYWADKVKWQDMTAANLRELGFTKMGHHEDDDWPEGYFYFSIEFGDMLFHSGGNDEAEEDGGWYIQDPAMTIKIWQYSEAKSLIDVLRRNTVSKISI